MSNIYDQFDSDTAVLDVKPEHMAAAWSGQGQVPKQEDPSEVNLRVANRFRAQAQKIRQEGRENDAAALEARADEVQKHGLLATIGSSLKRGAGQALEEAMTPAKPVQKILASSEQAFKDAPAGSLEEKLAKAGLFAGEFAGQMTAPANLPAMASSEAVPILSRLAPAANPVLRGTSAAMNTAMAMPMAEAAGAAAGEASVDPTPANLGAALGATALAILGGAGAASELLFKPLPTFKPGMETELSGLAGRAKAAAEVLRKENKPELADALQSRATELQSRVNESPPPTEEATPQPVPEEKTTAGMLSEEPSVPAATNEVDSAPQILNKKSDERTPERTLSKGSFRVDPAERGPEFFRAISELSESHPQGSAVEVKPAEFYSDPANRVFLAEDGRAGVVVKPDGDLVSVFRHKDSKQKIGPLLAEASEHATKLDGFDIDGFLPSLYARHGFKPVARVTFNDEYAPPGWSYEANGRPDNVFMVRDPKHVLDVSDYDHYHEIKDQVPEVSFDDALRLQQEAVDQVAKDEKRPVAKLLNTDELPPKELWRRVDERYSAAAGGEPTRAIDDEFRRSTSRSILAR